ncbi:MAG: hypothetical protein ACLSVD_00930 [Eggerthellaceae bacterium]
MPSRLDQLRSTVGCRRCWPHRAISKTAKRWWSGAQLLDQLTARFDAVVANTGAAWPSSMPCC